MMATFTMEAQSIPVFAGSDMQLASSLRIISPTAADRDGVTKKSDSDSRIAAKDVGKSAADDENQVQSASDLR